MYQGHTIKCKRALNLAKRTRARSAHTAFYTYFTRHAAISSIF